LLEFIKTAQDARGKIFFFKYENMNVNFAEIKKNYARGGHYHEYDQHHLILSGSVEYREEDIESKKEKITIVHAPATLFVPKKTAHLLIALEDTLFAESFNQEYVAIDYPKYRKIVKDKLN